jgi:hypothetical protein
MWHVIVITLVIDISGLLLVYALLRNRVRRATSAAAQMAELREEVSRLVVELNQTAERNVALLEDRISGLSDLIAAADRKIALLQREIEKHDVGVKVYSRIAESTANSSATSRSSPRLSVELSEKKELSDREAQKPPDQGTVLASQRQEARQRVVMLSRSGFAAPLIAARVGMPLGEVELIISLERQRVSQASGRQDEQPV